VRAQPDPKQMAGIPRPVDDLPNGAVSVRLIRGTLSNNIAKHPVELRVGSKVLTVKTDDNGRAQFNDLTPNATVKASADVDGEHLESQEFPAPARGGIRLMLVATDRSKGPATTPDAPAIAGQVVLGDQSRIVMEPREETVELFYLLDIANNARVPVNTTAPFVFDMPKEARGTGLMEGSSPQATVVGPRVTVQGPFAPGHTFVQVACELAAADGSVEIALKLPANVEQLSVVVKKVGALTLSSPQLKEQREIPANGELFIAATGGPVAAGQPIQLSLSGVLHHSPAPRIVALTLAFGIALVGTWAAARSTDHVATRAAERKRLLARRDRLFNDLIRLEHDRRNGRTDDRRDAARRDDLLASLEQIYAALDNDTGADPAHRAGIAAPLDGLGAT
jgi:hypothetical protein